MASSTSVKKNKRSSNYRKSNLVGYLFISPVIAGLLIWTIGPMLASAYYSLTNYNIVSPPEFVGVQNFVDLFTRDRLFIRSIKVTLNYALLFIVIGQVVSLLIAILLTQKARGMAFFRTLYYLPVVVPLVASSLLWRYMFNNEFGLINSIIEFFGMQGPNWLGSPDWALTSLVIMSIWGGAVSTIIYVAGLQNIPEELVDASKIDGANPIQRFLRITIPLLTPTIFFNVVTNIIASFQFFVPAFVMTEGGPVRSTYFYNLNLYDKAFRWLQMGYASAMAWVLFMFIIVLTFLIFRSSPLWVYYDGEVRQ